jgi:hypothetical protein
LYRPWIYFYKNIFTFSSIFTKRWRLHDLLLCSIQKTKKNNFYFCWCNIDYTLHFDKDTKRLFMAFFFLSNILYIPKEDGQWQITSDITFNLVNGMQLLVNFRLLIEDRYNFFLMLKMSYTRCSSIISMSSYSTLLNRIPR